MASLLHTPKHEDLIYDVGMHKGEDTEYYLRKGFRVIAVEADPELARACRERLRKYIADNRLIIVEGAIVTPAAVRAGQKTVRFHKSDHSVWGTALADWASRNETLGVASTAIDVEAVDFEAILEKHGVPHYMKVDIEGCDMICIEALRSFAARPDYVSIESDKTSFAGLKGEIDALAALGYDAFQAVEQSAIPASQTPPNPPREGRYVAQKFEDGCSGLFGRELEDRWKSRQEILRQYRLIRFGYYLLGDDGIMNSWGFPGAWRLRSVASGVLHRLTKAAVPGWYDTHARHGSVRRTGGNQPTAS
jgi:FkbM family methyltransferase